MCFFQELIHAVHPPPFFHFYFQLLQLAVIVIFFVLIFVLFIQFFFLFLSRCNYEKECEISAVSADFGGDPCPRTPKYLEVYYGCYPGKPLGTVPRDQGQPDHQFIVLKGVCHEIFGIFFSVTNQLKCFRILFLFLFHGSI